VTVVATAAGGEPGARGLAEAVQISRQTARSLPDSITRSAHCCVRRRAGATAATAAAPAGAAAPDDSQQDGSSPSGSQSDGKLLIASGAPEAGAECMQAGAHAGIPAGEPRYLVACTLCGTHTFHTSCYTVSA
jgi:hypothetical protein